jgi:glycosyltransferase involved in cell wall biosynthesis
MNVVFLETKLNLKWTSMQEILPQLENVWSHALNKSGHEYSCICVDEMTPKMCSKILLEADLIVVSAFNAKVAGFLKVTRELFGLQTPWAFYLHNQATIGLWPLYEFGIGSLLHSRDIFIGTCAGDQKLIESLYENASFELIPFYSEGVKAKTVELQRDIQKIVFIGRISEQKNLHSLIVAIKILKDQGKRFELLLYGKEDNLGSPNMGLESSSYLEVLLSIRSKLGLDDEVQFLGFVDRRDLEKMMTNEDVIFCTPSVHSDENFGMAALMALKCGKRIVTSHWGGHKNFKREFPELVFDFPVYQGGDGPFINVIELADCLKLASEAQGKFTIDFTFFDKENVIKKIDSFLTQFESLEQESSPLIKKNLLERVLRARKEYKKESPQKVFENYSDELAQPFFQAYGATDFEFDEVGALNRTLPWVEQRDTYNVEDPQKGKRSLSEKEMKILGYIY